MNSHSIFKTACLPLFCHFQFSSTFHDFGFELQPRVLYSRHRSALSLRHCRPSDFQGALLPLLGLCSHVCSQPLDVTFQPCKHQILSVGRAPQLLLLLSQVFLQLHHLFLQEGSQGVKVPSQLRLLSPQSFQLLLSGVVDRDLFLSVFRQSLHDSLDLPSERYGRRRDRFLFRGPHLSPAACGYGRGRDVVDLSSGRRATHGTSSAAC
mmetsp:Transcript_7802/g.15192  ORF Transcript_7802/g.15192 Transcript_7802/m.15192 type:complete len:208 (-) Transcript_7802:358-981(-)